MTSRPSPAELAHRALALLALTALTTGLPVGLWLLGGTCLPHRIPTWEQITAAMSGPDTGVVFTAFLVLIGWAAWAVFALSVVVELPAQLRGLAAPRLPGLGAAQQLAGLLVAAVLGMSGPVLAVSSPATAVPVTVTADPVNTEPTPPASAADQVAPTPPPPPGPRYTVQPRDTLGRIAARYLGDWARFEEIFQLNRGLPQPDGRELTDARLIRPGWVLVLPYDAAPTPVDGQAVVRPGDTLTEIAEREGLVSWRPIFEFNAGEPQPGGGRFTDPDLIVPGQVLDIPAPAATVPAPPTTSPGPPRGQEPPSAPSPSFPPSSAPATPPQPSGAPATTPPPTASPHAPTAAPTPPAPTMASDTPTPGRGAAYASRQPAGTSPADLAAVLAGGGALLAAGIGTVAMARRRQRLRRRRIGHRIASLPTAVARTEAAVRTAAEAGRADYTDLDLALRGLAVALTDTPGGQLPDVAAALLTGHRLELRLHTPADSTPPAPWESDSTGKRWSLDLRADNPVDPDRARGRLAPYPALVTVGSQGDYRWLLDLERVGVLRLDGPRALRENFCRHLAAELAVNSWSDLIHVTTAGFGTELTELNPERLTHTEDPGPAAATMTTELRDADHPDDGRRDAVLHGRLHASAGDGWMPTILLAPHGSANTDDLASLTATLCRQDDRSAQAVVLAAEPPGDGDGWRLTLTTGGTLRIPELDLMLQACQLTADQAADIAALLAFERTADDVPLPAAEVGPLGQPEGPATADGGGPDIPTAPRGADDRAREPTSTGVDPLDRDLVDWWDPDCPRPRLTLLGPIALRAQGDDEAIARSGYRRRYEEMLAYLATRPHGATVEEAAEALRPDLTDPVAARAYVHRVTTGVRAWLGTDPTTGEKHLSSGRSGRAYTLRNVLVDAELFRRLRARAAGRAGGGRADLLAALDLVSGPPFGQRSIGYEWLQGLDLAHTAEICDVAHAVVAAALADGDLAAARAASTAALLVAPDDENVLLDAMWVAFGDGNRAEAEAFVARIVEVNDGEDEMDLHLSTAEAIARARREFASRAS